jgi:hypothetical protein
VFENSKQRRIFVPKRGEVIECWRKVHSKELHNLHCSPGVVRTIKSWRMRWAGHVARMLENRNAIFFYGKPRRIETTRKI